MQSDRLFLFKTTLPVLESALAGEWKTFSTLLGGVGLAEKWLHFEDSLPWMHRYLQQHPEELSSPWWHYLIIHRADHCLIGSCGFKGGPTAEGTVEIGYEIADGYQGQGLATEAARMLVEHAFRHPEVAAVLAHTLAAENPSVGVLRKLGFQFVREKMDPDDGAVWEWRLPSL
jgi:ribosomal-protein-alanine N-acetyltransferase